MKNLFFLMMLLTCGRCNCQSVTSLFDRFFREYKALKVPEFTFDYKQNFSGIPAPEKLGLQSILLKKYANLAASIDTQSLSLQEKTDLDHFSYVLRHFQKKISLERSFLTSGKPEIPDGGLSKLPNAREWYRFYTEHYTTTSLSPEELKAFGEKEVGRCLRELSRLEKEMGYEGRTAGLLDYLNSPRFYRSDTLEIYRIYREKEAVIRQNMPRLFEFTQCDSFHIGTWQGATPAFPPAIYVAERTSFDFNFATGRHSLRAMDWVLNHEAIPGHHYQFQMERQLKISRPSFEELMFCSGYAEGWACYTEYLGKELGQYQTPEEEYAKWQWDLVRSARVVFDAGIHAFGWSKTEALEYWKAHITGQDDIAEREINRVTNWPAQALSYKVGAMKIEEMKQRLGVTAEHIRRFHTAFLSFGEMPVEVVEKHIAEVFENLNP